MLRVNDKIKIIDRGKILKITAIKMDKKIEIASLIDADGNRYNYLLKDLERSIETKSQIIKL